MTNPKNRSLKVGLAQISPIWLDREKTIAKVLIYMDKAADAGCSLVTFGEAMVPGYTWWLERTDGARFESDRQKEIHALYIDQAVDIEAGHLNSIAKKRKNGRSRWHWELLRNPRREAVIRFFVQPFISTPRVKSVRYIASWFLLTMSDCAGHTATVTAFESIRWSRSRSVY